MVQRLTTIVLIAMFFVGLIALFLVGLNNANARTVLEKTPFPCQDKYDSEFVVRAANKFLYGKPRNHAEPHMLLLFGGSGAGKGSFIRFIEKHGFPLGEYVFHGIDEYLILLPEYMKTMSDHENIYKDAADNCYMSGAIPIAKAAEKSIIDSKMHLIYEDTGKNLARVLNKTVPPFEGAGYRITLALVDNYVETAKIRSFDRFQQEGRYASDAYIEGTYRNVFENFQIVRKKDFVVESVYCDNSEDKMGHLRCWDVTFNPKVTPLVPRTALQSGQPKYLQKSSNHAGEL